MRGERGAPTAVGDLGSRCKWIFFLLVCLWLKGNRAEAWPSTTAWDAGRGRLFVRFVEGENSPAEFLLTGEGYQAHFAPDHVRFVIQGRALVLRFEGGSGARLQGEDSSGAQLSFFLGDVGTTALHALGYRSIWYRELYPGIDLRYQIDHGALKSEFRVRPGAEPRQIRLVWEGATRVWVRPDGSLAVEGPWGRLIERAPSMWQERGKVTEPVRGGFRVDRAGRVGFWLEGYDPDLPLVIDPAFELVTYFGGSGIDKIEDAVVDSSGNIYVAGWTDSSNLPQLAPLQGRSGSVDAFVAKFRGSDGALLFATYLGGSGDDRAFGIRLDSTGNVWVTGWTTSGNFPTRQALRSSLAGGRDAFVVKLSADGQQLLFGTYLGGGGQDAGYAIAEAPNGEIWIGGETSSLNFPTYQALQASLRGPLDGFLVRLTSQGSLVYSSYFGGSSQDRIQAVAIDSAGAVYVGGMTDSTDLPTLQAFQTVNRGGQEGFVAKFAPDGRSLLYCSYIGGSSGSAALPEWVSAVAVDASGRAYLAGTTSSVDFPVVGAYQPQHGGGSLDAFLARVSADGRTLEFSTYFGGRAADYGEAVAVDRAGAVYLAGYSASPDLPATQGSQTTLSGLYDGFVAKFDGSNLTFATYLGGASVDGIAAIAIDPSGKLVVAGSTQSWNLPVVNAWQSNLAGSLDGFLARLTSDVPAAPEAISVTPASGSGVSQVFEFLYRDANGWQDMRWTYMLISASLTPTASCYLHYSYRDNTVWLRDDAGASWLGPATLGTATVLENSQCSVNAGASSANGSGTDLTVRLAITFKEAYWGFKYVYMYVADTTGRASGWQQRGTWGAGGNLAPQAISVTPSGGMGTTQTFAFLFRDPNGWQEMRWSYVLIASSLTPSSSCYVHYNLAENSLRLRNDAGTGWLGPVTMGSQAMLENSQCAINAAASSVNGANTDMTLRLAITFKPAYAGSKNIYMYVADTGGSSSGWQLKGSWEAGANAAPEAVSVTPASGSGTSQTFAFLFRDPNGWQQMRWSYVLIAPGLMQENSCYVHYNQAENTLRLRNDAGTSWLGPVAPGAQALLENSQCTINAAASSVSGSGTDMVLQLAISFKAGYRGSKYIYMTVVDTAGASSGWQQRGQWTVP